MSLLEIVKYSYVLALFSVVILELTKSSRVARYAARLAIVLSLCGSSTWVYAAYFAPHPAGVAFVRPATHKSAPANVEDENEGMDLGQADGEASNGRGKGGHGGAIAGRDENGPLGSLVHEAAVALGLAKDATDPCPHCPDLVWVTAGSSPIGAPASDAAATAAEMPQQLVRIWPGFSISKAAVSEEDFTAFLVASGRVKRACSTPLAAVTADSNGAAMRASGPATCVSPAEAEAYVSWLTTSTGKHFRLPTAVEWEYAVRTVEPASLRMGEVAEVVADCWVGRLPSPLTAQSEASSCNRRIVKGASAIDEARWHRPSARRMLDADAAPLDVGFRVVQEN